MHVQYMNKHYNNDDDDDDDDNDDDDVNENSFSSLHLNLVKPFTSE